MLRVFQGELSIKPAGAALHAPRIASFLQSTVPLISRIKSSLSCFCHECFNDSALNDDGAVALSDLRIEFKDFIESGDWIDKDVRVISCTDFWSRELFDRYISESMTFDQAYDTILTTQRDQETSYFRILDDPDFIMDLYYQP